MTCYPNLGFSQISDQNNHTYINIIEKGPYIIQECENISKYVIWNKTKREHIMENNNIAFFEDIEIAKTIAEEMMNGDMLNNYIPIYQKTDYDIEFDIAK